MKLTDLNPQWVGAGGEGISDAKGRPVPERSGVGLLFDCPCGCRDRVYVAFENPLDGGPPHVSPNQATWTRTGEDFGSISLAPSILRVAGCRWHGFVTAGEVSTA